MLFDILIKFCADPRNYASQGIDFYPVTPGSLTFAQNRGLQISQRAVLTAQQLQSEFVAGNLKNFFNRVPLSIVKESSPNPAMKRVVQIPFKILIFHLMKEH